MLWRDPDSSTCSTLESWDTPAHQTQTNMTNDFLAVLSVDHPISGYVLNCWPIPIQRGPKIGVPTKSSKIRSFWNILVLRPMVLGTPILRNPHIVFMVCSIFQHLSSRNLIYEPLATASIVVRHVFLIIGAPGSGAPQQEQIPHQDKGHLSTKRMGISAIKNDDVTDVTYRLCLDIVEIFPHQLPFYFFDKKPLDLSTRSLGKPWWEDRCQTTWDPALGASTSQSSSGITCPCWTAVIFTLKR